MRKCSLLVVLILAVIHANGAVAQTDTTFTYQGELKQSGQPANGNYNLTFSLWDSLQNGSQILGDLQINGVPVSEGTFTVQLDFGAHAFDNANRWLEIDVNGQTLVPRQLISRSPYSIQTRGIYVASDGKVGIGTTNPAADLEVDGTASPDTGLIIRAPGGATGQVAVSSPGGETGFIGIANGGNRRDIRFSDEGISLLTNNAPTIPSQLNGMHILENGHVAIGTLTPSPNAVLHVEGGDPAILGVTDESLGAAVQGRYTHPTGTGVAIAGLSESANGYAGLFLGGRNYFQGNVGIGSGTFPPQFRLDVNGSVRLAGLSAGAGTDLHINSSTGEVLRNTSSRRYKKNIEALDLASLSEAVLQLQPVSYDYRDTGQHDIGLIAEDVAALIPELVTFDQEGRPDAVKYDRGFLYLLALVKKQAEDLAELKQRLAEQESLQ